MDSNCKKDVHDVIQIAGKKAAKKTKFILDGVEGLQMDVVVEQKRNNSRRRVDLSFRSIGEDGQSWCQSKQEDDPSSKHGDFP